MQNLFAEVMDLQQNWSHENTPDMERRGKIIRQEIPAWLSLQKGVISEALGPSGADFIVEGRDGTGRKTEVPWVRFGSARYSPNAREGWYGVYLFRPKGDGFYLVLGHGSTRWENGEFKPRPIEELDGLVKWAHGILHEELQLLDNLAPKISLGAKGKLGAAYENGTVASIWYSRDSVPTDEQLSSDVRTFSKLLGKLYDAEALGRSLESAARQAAEIQEIVREQVKSNRANRGSGQGFGLSAEERKAIELRAMEIALKDLQSEGYSVLDVSRTHSYDFIATKDGISKIVEVKGTTNKGDNIILTANEVLAHTERHPNNILIIVHSIDLDRKTTPPKASGGIKVTISPWLIFSEKLKPLTYQYSILQNLDQKK